jgi:hypothetical protein
VGITSTGADAVYPVRYVDGVTLIVQGDIAPAPVDVGFFGVWGVMLEARVATLIEKLLPGRLLCSVFSAH